MKLIPEHSPGRVTRKAKDYETEIVQLRAEGYTLEAIRTALAHAGVHVSISTVRREASRRVASKPFPASATGEVPGDQQNTAATPDASAPDVTPVTTAQPLWTGRSALEVVEAFSNSWITNPLIRARGRR